MKAASSKVGRFNKLSVPVNGEAAIDLVKINAEGSAQVLAAAIPAAGAYDRIRPLTGTLTV